MKIYYFWSRVSFRYAVFRFKGQKITDSDDTNPGVLQISNVGERPESKRRKTASLAKKMVKNIPLYGNKLHVSTKKMIDPVVAKKKDGYTFKKFLTDPDVTNENVVFGHKIFHVPTFRSVNLKIT